VCGWRLDSVGREQISMAGYREDGYELSGFKKAGDFMIRTM
jgi:hypothetical protein